MQNLAVAWVLAICTIGLLLCVGGLLLSRSKPVDWVPPAWFRAGYFGRVDRDFFRFTCACGLVVFPLFAALTLSMTVQ